MINDYVKAAVISLVLFGMGMASMILGIRLFRGNIHSKGNKRMFLVFLCVFAWDTGYSLMGLSYDSDFAYIARSFSLMAVFMYNAACISYVGYLAGYPESRLRLFYVPYGAVGLVSLIRLSSPESVDFQMTSWGYWYTTEFGWARYVQFGCIMAAIVMYYVVLRFWWVRAQLKRQQYIIRGFMWFPPIVCAGYILDTLVPALAHTPAIPGTAVSSFVSALMLFSISKKYKAFDITKGNVSEYVFRDVTIPVMVMDWQGKIVLWNQHATTYFSRRGNELLGLKREDLVSLPHEDFMLKGISAEEIYITNDRHLYCEFQTTEIFDEFHEPLYTICFVRDISETQNALKMMDESRRIAEAANRSKSAFLTNMSHEIRTPMNAIIGMSDILLSNPDMSGDERQQVMNIREAGMSLLGIINDVLDISKIEAGKYEIVENEYSMGDMIHAVSSIIRMRLAETSIEYIVDVDPDIPSHLTGDELKIRQILINILGNAVKFTESGYIRLKLRGVKEGDAYRLYADVEDSGIGIREADLARIFEAFNQVDTHKNRNRQGTGLGLSIALRLSQSMGGNVTVESTYGKGTIFHINILQKLKDYEPLGEEVCTRLRNDEYEYIEAKKEIRYTPHPGKRILVVDDSKVNLMVAKGLLNPYGMEMEFASRGATAVEMAAAHDYDLIFMDHMMPEMDGVETTHAIRRLGGHNAEVPIVALTANAIDGTRQALIAEGMQDFITKPIDKVELDNVIEKYCG